MHQTLCLFDLKRGLLSLSMAGRSILSRKGGRRGGALPVDGGDLFSGTYCRTTIVSNEIYVVPGGSSGEADCRISSDLFAIHYGANGVKLFYAIFGLFGDGVWTELPQSVY